jgi:membrane-bound lytic murein transglycosylase D
MKFRSIYFIAFSLFLLSATQIHSDRSTAFKDNDEGQSSKVFALKLPEIIDFAGEVVPIEFPDIKERFDKELLVNTYWQSNMLLLLKRANKYFPLIEKILEEEGIPDDFKYLAVIESALENARSPKGAKGFWQIMPNTGREYGLEVNANVDERYHIEKSTRVASSYLIKAKKRLGSWTLAAASYNRGMSGISRLLKKQLADNYYDLLLNNETSRYIFRILAVKEIMSHPDRYGFVFSKEDLYTPIPLRKIGLDTAIGNLAAFSKAQKINYKILKIHNKWLIENHLNNRSRKFYEISIPEEGYY